MNKKISEKDIKDWKEFTESNSKIENKDIDFVQLEKISNRTLDLHGLTLEIANKKIEQFIKSSFDKNVEKITVITGKGLRSKVDQNPYQSKDLSILKYSVPEFIRNNLELMSLIKNIDDQTENKNSGSFIIHLKSKNRILLNKKIKQIESEFLKKIGGI